MKRYYIDVTIDQSNFVAETESEAIEQAQKCLEQWGAEFTVYETEDV